jgi:hypothetical protein
MTSSPNAKEQPHRHSQFFPINPTPTFSSDLVPSSVVTAATPIITPVIAPYVSEKSGLNNYHPLTPLHSTHPSTWTVADVCEWLQSKNVADYIIKAFYDEHIAGRSLLHLSKEDLGVIGVARYGDRLEVARLIGELKEEWIAKDGMGGGVMDVMNVVSGAAILEGDGGKGAPQTDAPPSYRAA